MAWPEHVSSFVFILKSWITQVHVIPHALPAGVTASPGTRNLLCHSSCIKNNRTSLETQQVVVQNRDWMWSKIETPIGGPVQNIPWSLSSYSGTVFREGGTTAVTPYETFLATFLFPICLSFNDRQMGTWLSILGIQRIATFQQCLLFSKKRLKDVC